MPSFSKIANLSAIDFSEISDTRDLVRQRSRQMFGIQNDGYIDEYLDSITQLFAGHHPEYQAVDTAYHDITHTLQATLCLVEILHNRYKTDAAPPVTEKDFKRALVAVLFHDIGYLKTVGDNQGSGAKYTHIHEQRSCVLLRNYLEQRRWADSDIIFVENLVNSTGPRADLTKIPFRSEIERLMGQAVCTADYVGQMSDPDYPDKLKVLFDEFEESFKYQRIPRSKWPFSSYEALLRATPNFWGTFVQHKMEVECGGVWEYLRRPLSENNLYFDSIERNMSTIQRRIEKLDNKGQEVQAQYAARAL